jgi:hypothetical protein
VAYYKNLATGFASASSAMKELTNKLPPGASDYCNYIFSVAENSAKAAKVVGDYTTRLINEFKEFDKALAKVGEKNSALNISLERPPKGIKSSDSWVNMK